MPELQNPVVVIPGITGTSLYDEYPLDAQPLWTSVLNRDYDRLSLHPEDVRYEATEPALVRTRALLGIAYDDLLKALRHDLTARPDQPTPVFAFPYDWRQDVRQSGAQLAAFVNEVVARTKLLRHYKGYGDNPKVDLVGHSMGGLIICEYLSQFPSSHNIGKVATLGTPYLGSLEAIVKLLTGLGNLSGDVPKEREREAARSMPAIYQLLPSFKGAIKPATDMFDVRAWQPGVLQSLAEYIRLHSVEPGNKPARSQRATDLLAELLAIAKRHRDVVGSLSLQEGGLTQSDWLAVVGVGAKTRVRMNVTRGEGSPRYIISEEDCRNEPGTTDTGDGTVPLLGAIPPFLPPEQLVAVSPENFGFWEVRDRVLAREAGFHAMLPNLNLSQRLVLKHFRGRRYSAPLHGAAPIPGVRSSDWQPCIPVLKS